eukprot:8912896-Pyramimonas_sp.AAC.1
MEREQISQSGCFELWVMQCIGSIGFFCLFGRTRLLSWCTLMNVSICRSSREVDVLPASA